MQISKFITNFAATKNKTKKNNNRTTKSDYEKNKLACRSCSRFGTLGMF